MAPSAVNNGARALEGLIARWYKDTNGSVATTGSADTYVMAANQTLTAYYDGLVICVDINATNTGASTINVDSLGAKSILKHNDQALAAGDLEAGGKYLMAYDGTSFQLLSALGNAPAVITADNSFTADQTIVSTDAGATEGPALDLHRNSASPANSDLIGTVRFKGEDDGSNVTTYGKFVGVIDDVAGGTEDGGVRVDSMIAGTLTSGFRLGASIYADGKTDPGAGGIDADAMYQSAERVEATKLDTEQATTSGTEFDFNSPFTTTTRIIVMTDGCSLAGGTDEIIVQLGDASSFETSAYVGRVGSNGGTAYSGSGFQLQNVGSAGDVVTGELHLSLINSANNTWIGSHIFDTGPEAIYGAGNKSLTGALTRVRLTRNGATDAFDAGAVNVRWYGY